ncbi:hypothetical protein F5J12DRAFT_761217 [Pisolithus orientalis]|uniref:uncharacterized protein n=1 Tax=Pisolithus orientalis TaxID=936130 RepID=UPI0022244B77|nr:uncharacterized protein F5J12DRAFT_761217 [Pisolithus orientalis]KAI6032783.1 hypothetical protein F5J12DRAFT_761217 [Pisolithus orientalis]
MLAPCRNHRTEAKYNVTTEFPYLGLHSASASGDIGLVQYALSHGQPVNSVLDGVLPLHAACAGGNDLVVKLLIEHGADVNAPRLPRRYSDRNRDVSAPIVGTSGSTPLHFASANGHLTVVRTLLAHGAIPDGADKHGITAEHIARENGWIECAELLAECVANVREKQRSARSDNKPDNDTAVRSVLCPTDHAESPLRRRLNFKCSIDHALNALKSGSGSSTPDVESRSVSLHPDSLEQSQPRESTHPAPLVPGRRPSLPQADDGRSPGVLSRSRRPRSAGTGAETTSRKLHPKLSLLSLFRKSNDDGSNSSVTSIPEHKGRFPLPSSSMPCDPSPPSSVAGSPPNHSTSLSSSPRDASQHEYQGRSDSAASVSGVGDSALHPAELQNSFADNHHSTPGSSSASGFSEGKATDNVSMSSSGVPLRQGILRMHNRSSSAGHSASEQPLTSSRILRFQSSTSSIKSIGRSRNPSGRGGQSSRSLNTSSGGQLEEDHDGIPDTIEESPVVPPQPNPPIFINLLDDEDDMDEEYGVPLNSTTLPSGSTDSVGPSMGVSPLPFSISSPPPTEELATSSTADSRLRGDSISSKDTTSTTSTYPPSSSSDAVWSLGTPDTPHLSPHPIIVPVQGEISSVNGLVHETRESHRAKPLLLDINISSISSISSYAQAEELVQRTQQSIMNMEQYLEGNTTRNTETGRTALSAKLAAYGESLAIERRLKEARTWKRPSEVDMKRVYHRGRYSLSSANLSTPDNAMSRAHSADAVMNEETPVREHEAYGGHASRITSVSGPDTHPTLGGTERFLYTPPRSRTPKLDPDFNDGVSFSHISAAHSTRFPRNCGRDADPTRSARKLSRMGFSTVDAWHPNPYKREVSRSPPPKHFFGGIRTLMQSLQGK